MTILQHYCHASTVIKAKVTGEKFIPHDTTEYEVEVVETIKSPKVLPSSIKLSSPWYELYCGHQLEQNSTYIITANYVEPNLYFTFCHYILNLDHATDDEKKSAFDPLKPSLNCSQTVA
ncbi:hypothetical protein B4U79_18814 [Dinothrombium tinctorium]|uniref:NTR domain-containing protein n=1 Tax=Dinothrombium tinctorium TaxID=1965070 RepID=A0A443Q8F5_9ACAR|nr:hypothetical protein B4U79_18814 [Dinothrombium tinctorium]